MIVLDSSALLALIQNERGGEMVADRARGAMMSAVNYVEVVTRVIDLDLPETKAFEAVRRLRIDVVAHDKQLAERAGILRRATRHLGLSLGDRSCLALAERAAASVLTADRCWAELDLGIDIELIR